MIQQLQVAGQVLVIVLLYLFVWQVMRTARSDVAAPFGDSSGSSGAAGLGQESMVISPDDVDRERRAARLGEPRIVVRSSSSVREGVPFTIGRGGLTVGRGDDNDIVLLDAAVSRNHARFVAPNVVQDRNSANGIFINGQRAGARTQLQAGDRIRIGDTEFTFEVTS